MQKFNTHGNTLEHFSKQIANKQYLGALKKEKKRNKNPIHVKNRNERKREERISKRIKIRKAAYETKVGPGGRMKIRGLQASFAHIFMYSNYSKLKTHASDENYATFCKNFTRGQKKIFIFISPEKLKKKRKKIRRHFFLE